MNTHSFLFKPIGPETESGLLVQVEGLDGSGKTTILGEVRRRLDLLGYETVISNWNDTAEMYNLMTRLNLHGELDAKTRCILGSAELAARQQYITGPALRRGAIVFAPKYIVSLFAHSLIRGHRRDFLDKLYSFAIPPNLTFYFDVSPSEALRRKLVSGRIGFWESGLDLKLNLPLAEALSSFASDVYEQAFISDAFKDFQSRLRDIHLSLLPREAMIIDAEREVDEVAETVMSLLEPVLPVHTLQMIGTAGNNRL